MKMILTLAGCVGGPDDWKEGKGMAPVPKISYPSEEQAVHVINNIRIMDAQKFGYLGYLCDSADLLVDSHYFFSK